MLVAYLLAFAADGVAALPNTRIDYYDVAGRDVGAINRSIRQSRPKTAAGKTIPSSTDWQVKAGFERTSVGGQCRVSAATATFNAAVTLPRLTEGDRLTRTERERWNQYVALLEQNSAATLAFVVANVGTVEQAMLAAPCERAGQVGAEAIRRLRAHADRIAADREKRLARLNDSLSEFRPATLSAAKTDCRNLKVTGSRAQTVRICLPAREWERMSADGQAFTFEMQDQSIDGKRF